MTSGLSVTPPSDCVVLGGGISGCAAAHFLRGMGAKVTLVERDNDLGGIARSYQLGGQIYDFGPHMLHATNSNTMELYKQFDIRELDYYAKMSYSGTLDGLVDFPFSLDTIFQLPVDIAKQVVAELYALDSKRRDSTNLETNLISAFGETLYRLCNEGYSRKFWGMAPTDVPSNGAASWISFRATDKRLYAEWQAYPNGGFNSIYDGLTTGVQVVTATATGLGDVRNGRLTAIKTTAGDIGGDHFVSTLTPEVLWPVEPDARLKYIGKVVVALRLKEGPFNPVGIGGIYFPQERWRFNRIVEYPAMTERSYPDLPDGTVVTLEYPLVPWKPEQIFSDQFYIDDAVAQIAQLRPVEVVGARVHRHESIYPFRDDGQLALYRGYRARLAEFENLSMTGRYGNFVYVNMNHCIEMAAKVVAGLWGVSAEEVFQQAAALC
ncbi:MAG: FAD-dependent oxidoreductase [Gemmatimonadetes bacterium]|nr:FAD-dependent oxidoreductase [Gemmatimonadota bacterium]